MWLSVHFRYCGPDAMWSFIVKRFESTSLNFHKCIINKSMSKKLLAARYCSIQLRVDEVVEKSQEDCTGKKGHKGTTNKA